MKFHALALCLAGTLVASAAAFAQDNPGSSGSQGNYDRYSHNHDRGDADYTARDPYTGYSVYAGDHLYYRDVLYPDLPDIQSVAQKVSEITQMQNQEIAELRTLSPKAVTAGYQNVHSVYEYMIDDHQQFVGFTDRWLTENGYAVPTAPETSAAVADEAPEKSVDQQIEEHETMMNHAIAMRQGEPSSTVRGLLLWSATTSARHITLLRTLDSDLARGRKDLSARLQIEMAPVTMTAETSDRLFEQWLTEDREYYASLPAPPTTEVAEVPEPEEPVAVAPAPAPAPAPTAETPAPAPKPAPVAETPAPATNNNLNNGTSRVAGSRQNTGNYRTRTRRHTRRPAY